MKWLEEEIAKNEKRVRKISENPDPTKLRCNKMLYELELALRKEQLAAFRGGEICVASGIIMIEALLRSLGLAPLDLQNAADHLMVADEYLRIAKAHGFPDNHCDRTVALIGMCLSGALPPPKLIVATNAGCDPLFLASNALAHKFDIPLFCLDVALEENEDTTRYVASQLEELIIFVERKLPGTKFDESKLEKLQQLNRQALIHLREIYQLRRQIPCPIPVEDTFRLPRLPACYPDADYGLNYWRAFCDELRERARKTEKYEEKLRLMWTCAAPYFANPFHVLTERHVSVPIFQLDIVARWMAGWGGIWGDPGYAGRKLTLLEEEARMVYSCGWVGIGKKWVDQVEFVCRDLKIDAVVNFMQVGCMATAGLARILSDTLEKELGIPTLNIEGRQLLSESYDKAQFEGALEEFVEMCLLRKSRP